MLGLLGFDPAWERSCGESAQGLDFAPKKLPSQRRSQETFDALVDACTWLLPRRGYAGTTTNHIAERAGVNIASLYEYFPGKDAIVAQVAERLVQRVLGRLAAGAARVLQAGEADAVRLWIEWIHDTVAREKELVAVFLYQVPYTNQLDADPGDRRAAARVLAAGALARRRLRAPRLLRRLAAPAHQPRHLDDHAARARAAARTSRAASCSTS